MESTALCCVSGTGSTSFSDKMLPKVLRKRADSKFSNPTDSIPEKLLDDLEDPEIGYIFACFPIHIFLQVYLE